MLTTLILAAALAGQCQPGMACYRGGYSYPPAVQYVLPQPNYAPYIPPQPTPTPAPTPAPTPNVLRPVPPSPYKAAAGPTVAEIDRKIDALAEQVKTLSGPKRAGPCTCGPDCKCSCGCAGGRVASSPPPVTAFRFH